MKHAIFTLLMFLCTDLAASGQLSHHEQLVVARIKWFLKIKEEATNHSWPEFQGRNNDVALIYFTNKACYLIDPGNVLQQRIATLPFYKDKAITIRRARHRIDDRAFHMETAMDNGDSSAIWYRYPVMLCSDYESTRQQVPDVNSLQDWAAMVLHEYFHGFQLKHAAMAAYGNDSITLPGSRLQSFYDTYDWFRQSVDKENELLLYYLSTADKDTMRRLLHSFVALREHRQERLKDTLHLSIAREECFYEKLEGTAKYVELHLLSMYKDLQPDHTLQQRDTAYRADTYRHFDLAAEPWRYATGGTLPYCYAMGFNMLRVLDKLGIDFKKRCFDDNTLTPYMLLAGYVARH